MATTRPLTTTTTFLPEGYLHGPAPALTITRLDFEKHDLVEYKNDWAVVLDGVLSQEECKALVSVAEQSNNGRWDRAEVNVGGGVTALYEETRKCGRIIYNSKELAARLWSRIEPAVPEIHRLHNRERVTGLGPWKRNETWKMTRLNERMRFLKYVGGEYFKPHCDATYVTPDGKERSYFTLHLYLNDAADQLDGGATIFQNLSMTKELSVVPKAGRVLLFQHRDLLHSGGDVLSGVKYTVRTDIMYTKEAEAEMENQ